VKKFILTLLFLLPLPARADLWGGDLALLAEIVTNTLNTLFELRHQTSLLKDEMAGINDKISRVKTISDLVQPSTWEEWRNPTEAIRRLERIYYTLPKEYRSEKSDLIEGEISKTMATVSRLSPEIRTTFLSGKELEQRGTNSSPGVAQKLTASGVGTLVALQAQSQALESHIATLLAQILADANEKESRGVVTRGLCLSNVAESLNQRDTRFSVHVGPLRMPR